MSDQSHQFHLDIPNFGRVPVQLTPDPNRGDSFTVTHAPSPGREPSTESADRAGLPRPTDINERPVPTGSIVPPGMDFLNPSVVAPVDTVNGITRFAVLGHKLVNLTVDQLEKLQGKYVTGERLQVRLSSNKDGQDKTVDLLSPTIQGFDCNCDSETAKPNHRELVLLTWDKTIPLSSSFPDITLFNPTTGDVEEVPKHKQTNNFVLSSDGGGPSNPPPTPPWTALSSAPLISQLNTQLKSNNFKTATLEDIQHYKQLDSQNSRPSVAVLDTGLKFNLFNTSKDGESNGDNYKYGPYIYLDAHGVERQFNLAHSDLSQTKCNAILDSSIGYCSIQAYRQSTFINTIQSSQNDSQNTEADVMNSPYDDCQIFEDVEEEVLQDARHGSIITALIQQNGDEAPVVPVKAFDNMGQTTLFDVLNGFNYILCNHKSAKIRVVNASWICTWNEPLLREKIQQLMNAGIFVIAAAGNEKQTINPNLDVVPTYPACYSKEFPNVIAVTSVRKTYIPHQLMSRQGDSVITGLLNHAIRDFGLFNLLETGDEVVGAILPTAGYIAVENYSTTFVNVGVVSTFGYFRSPFYTGRPIRGSSFACALVSAFVISQLSTRPDILPSQETFLDNDMDKARQKLLTSMSGVDDNLKEDYVNGGYYLAGYEIE